MRAFLAPPALFALIAIAAICLVVPMRIAGVN